MSATEFETSPSSEELDRLLADPSGRVHFVGLAGAGMSALAEHRQLEGGRVSGSDRFFDQGKELAEKNRFEALGVSVCPQDGSGITGATCVAASTAVEAVIPDLVEAHRQGVPVFHRSEILASLLRRGPNVAISGTSGKSSVAALTWTALHAAGTDPGLVTGGELLALRRDGKRGNAACGRGRLIVEADESDKSLVRYESDIGVVLNLHKDHAPAADMLPAFQRFQERTRGPFLISEDEILRPLRTGSEIYGFGPEATLRGEDLVLDARGSEFGFRGARVRVPFPGRYNAENALAAMAVACLAGADLVRAAEGIAGFAGVHRRFESHGTVRGIEVIDDFAHNPEKVRVTLAAVKQRAAGRVIAVFQPHGFAPTKFYRRELVEAFRRECNAEDLIIFQEIFYAGGTAVKDISSAEVIDDIRAAGLQAEVISDRSDLAGRVREFGRSGDVIVSMGARDPSLSPFAADLVAALDA